MAQLPESRFEKTQNLQMLADFPNHLAQKRCHIDATIGRMSIHAHNRDAEYYRKDMETLRILWAQYRAQMRQYWVLREKYGMPSTRTAA